MSTVDVIVGTLGRAHGLSGEIFVDLRTDSPQERFRPGAVLWAGESHPLEVVSFRIQSGRGLVRFADVSDRTHAEALTGARLVAHVPLDENADEDGVYFDHQLMGLTVVTTAGIEVGTVARIDHMGFQDMLVVATATGDRLVPFVDDLVPEVDLVNARVVVHAIPGLLEDAE
ncbi:MAG: ribosome maturation factor RimM [Propionibacteriaceae bacterium]|nr:ribosome maturation factor RimM [Propionibacteriaceae bacterium]